MYKLNKLAKQAIKIILAQAAFSMLIVISVPFTLVQASTCAPKLKEFGIKVPLEISDKNQIVTAMLVIEGLKCTPEELKNWVLNFKDVHNTSMNYYSDGYPLSELPKDVLNADTGVAAFQRSVNLYQFSALSVLQVFPVLFNLSADLTARTQANSKLCAIVKNKNYSMVTPNPNCVIPMQLLNVSKDTKGLGEGPTIKSVPDYDKGIGVFQNPLEGGTVGGLIAQAIRIMLVLVGASAVVVIAISGFQLVLSQGNPEKRTSAIRSITWAIIGLILSILSFSIVAILQRIIS